MDVLQIVAQKITNWCCTEAQPEDAQKKVIQYGIRLLLENLLRIIVIIVFGIVTHHTIETLWFLLCFPLLRAYAGGVHAKTSIGCTLLMIGCICICIIVNDFARFSVITALVLNVITNFLILMLAPNGSDTCEWIDSKYYHKKKKYALIINNVLWEISFLSN